MGAFGQAFSLASDGAKRSLSLPRYEGLATGPAGEP